MTSNPMRGVMCQANAAATPMSASTPSPSSHNPPLLTGRNGTVVTLMSADPSAAPTGAKMLARPIGGAAPSGPEAIMRAGAYPPKSALGWEADRRRQGDKCDLADSNLGAHPFRASEWSQFSTDRKSTRLNSSH